MWLHAEIRTLGDIPRHHARQTPDAPALIDDEGAVSWAELDRRSNQAAHALREVGVGAQDRVAFLGANSARYFELLFAAAKLGAALLPLNWRLAPPELLAILEDATPAVVVADRAHAEVAVAVVADGNLGCRVYVDDPSEAVGSRPASGPERLPAGDAGSDPAVDVNPWWTIILMYTSGTTGTPKGVQLSHQNYLYLRLCEHLEPSFAYSTDDVMLTVMPLFHAMGAGLALQALYNGAAVAVAPMPDPGGLIALIGRRRPTILPLVPTVIQMLLNHPEAADADFSSVRLVVYAGSPIGSDLLTKALDQLECDFIQFYGATETGAGVTFLRPDDHRRRAKLDSCGSPLPLIDIKIGDATAAELPRGEVGEVLLRSPSLTTGYFNQPEVTARAFRDGWYHTGDAGYRDADGYLFVVDRVKDMIITGGENVYSVEVEQALHRIPGVQACAVIGMPDDRWGERIVGVVAADPDAGLTEEGVIAACRELIAGYKVPKQVVFTATLPMTASGKVMKHELRPMVAEIDTTGRR
jgi:acyl-CoA synthetase (AMP-forming)/AMP-acid ligase II